MCCRHSSLQTHLHLFRLSEQLLNQSLQVQSGRPSGRINLVHGNNGHSIMSMISYRVRSTWAPWTLRLVRFGALKSLDTTVMSLKMGVTPWVFAHRRYFLRGSAVSAWSAFSKANTVNFSVYNKHTECK